MSPMLALVTVLPVVSMVVSMVLTSTERTGNAAGGRGFERVLDLPPWAYTVGGAVIFLAMLAVTFAFRSTGKRH